MITGASIGARPLVVKHFGPFLYSGTRPWTLIQKLRFNWHKQSLKGGLHKKVASSKSYLAISYFMGQRLGEEKGGSGGLC